MTPSAPKSGTSPSSTLCLEILDGAIGLVTFDTPNSRANTLGQAVLAELEDLVRQLAGRTDLRGLISAQRQSRYVDVTAAVSNFVPKPHTPYQWNGMQTREYLRWAGQYLRSRRRIRSVRINQHDIECSLLEGVLTRGDRRVAPALEEAWRRGCRLDGWKEHFKPDIWWQTFADLGIDTAWYSQRNRPVTEVLPWDHVNVKKGREYLEKEQGRSVAQLEVMKNATDDLTSPSPGIESAYPTG